MDFHKTCQQHQGLDRSTLHQVYYDLLNELPKNGLKMAGKYLKKRIISVGFDIPGFDDCYSYESSQSLLDADIVVFEPDLPYLADSTYQSERCFDEDTSFLLKKDTVHWRSERGICAVAIFRGSGFRNERGGGPYSDNPKAILPDSKGIRLRFTSPDQPRTQQSLRG